MSQIHKQSLKDSDPEVFATLNKELHRQQNQIELIASENIASLAEIGRASCSGS